MKVVSKLKVLMPVLFVVITWVLVPVTQVGASGVGEPGTVISPLLSLTGTLYRPGEKAVTGYISLAY